MRTTRPPTSIVASLALAAAVATLGVTVVAPATAADLSGFEPGNIISDATFFDSRTMAAPDIQTFQIGRAHV